MTASRHERNGLPMLSPFLEGWYFIASRKKIEKEKLFQKTWLGEEIIVWCDGGGRICVAEAICPHLGSELGPEAGGRVRNGCLVCPFHGFEYDVTGQCVATPFVPAPRSTKLKVFETREILGLVFAWRGSGGRPPQWTLPDTPPTGTDWTDLEFWSVRFPGHPQETTENSVDLGHLRYVHGYNSVNRIESVSIDGAYLKSCFDFKRTQTNAGIKVFTYDVSAVTHVHGLGYSFRRGSRACDRHGYAFVGARNAHRRQTRRTGVGQSGAANTETEAADRGHALPAVTPALQAHEQNHHVCPEAGRVAGRRHMEPKTLSAPPPVLSLGRGDWNVPTLLRAILSGSSGSSADRRGRRESRPSTPSLTRVSR